MANVLLLDIENMPLLGYAWRLWEANIIHVVRHPYICSISWKWLNERQVYCNILPDFPLYKRQPHSSKALMRKFGPILDKADVLVAHNIVGHDRPVINTEIVRHDLPLPKPCPIVDTLKIARSKFKFVSNKLDDLAEFFHIGRKLPHGGFDMWRECMEGKMKAWRLMAKYNIHDTFPLLEGVYKKLRPWDARHPDLSNLASERNYNCPVCGSSDRQPEGHRYNKSSYCERFSCKADGCGRWYSGPLIHQKKTLPVRQFKLVKRKTQ